MTRHLRGRRRAAQDSPWPGLALLATALIAPAAQAALQGRLPATPGGTDYRAYYDSVLGITWVADANLAKTSGYDADGLMTWPDAQAWIASLNAASYLGVSNWRLPGADLDGNLVVVDCAASTETACRDNELGYQHVRNLLSQVAATPFAGLAGASAGTWYATPSVAGSYWAYAFDGSGQSTHPQGDLLLAWAVRPGDVDGDGDGIVDSVDNCTATANPTQLDADLDGYGNACDGDLNNSGLTTSTDFNLLRSVLNLPANSGPLAAAADMNGSGLVTATDFNLLRARLNGAPGPSSVTSYALTASRLGAGSGVLSSTPAGIVCGADCAENYAARTVVLLTAAPGASSVFTGWSGACAGTGACMVTMNAATAVAGTFAAQYPLTASTSGTGSGTVTSSPVGINCGADCSEDYLAGTVVTLSASPLLGSAFSGWSGACAGTGSCQVTMSGARSVTANFTLLNGNPACATNQLLGSVSGDTGADVLSTSGNGERWLRVHLTEDDSNVFVTKYLAARITLTPPAGMDYDLNVYCASCGGTLAGSSSQGAGLPDTVDVRRNDTLGPDDSFDVLIEVRYFSGSSLANWNLSVTGNATVAAATCP